MTTSDDALRTGSLLTRYLLIRYLKDWCWYYIWRRQYWLYALCSVSQQVIKFTDWSLLSCFHQENRCLGCQMSVILVVVPKTNSNQPAHHHQPVLICISSLSHFLRDQPARTVRTFLFICKAATRQSRRRTDGLDYRSTEPWPAIVSKNSEIQSLCEVWHCLGWSQSWLGR